MPDAFGIAIAMGLFRVDLVHQFVLRRHHDIMITDVSAFDRLPPSGGFDSPCRGGRDTVCFTDLDDMEVVQQRLLQAALASYHGYNRLSEVTSDNDVRLFAQGVVGVRSSHCRILARDVLGGRAPSVLIDLEMEEVRDAWNRAVHHLRRGGSLSSPTFCRDIAFAESAYEALLTRVLQESHGRVRTLLMKLHRSVEETRVCWRELWDIEIATQS